MTKPECPIRPITRGPKFHWFGYYDKWQFDPAGRFVLGMEVDFEHRSPTTADTIRIGMVDLADGDRWIELGPSRAWCWQQGCMLQWLPGSQDEVIWNDREDGRLVSRVLNVATGEKRTLPHAVYTVSPDGRWAVAPDFFRVGWLRPGYGYAGEDPHRDVPAPDDSGISRIDLATGEAELIVSIGRIAARPDPHHDTAGLWQYFNHLLWGPDGGRFIFLNRCGRRDAGRGFYTRMFTADPGGGGLRLIDDFGGLSHFIWRDAGHILAWADRPDCGRAFCLFDEKTGEAEPVGPRAMDRDGHCSYLPGGKWILNDSYPGGEDRRQHLYLYHPGEDRRVELAALASPPEYAGEWRCDLHPRASRDGRQVCIDATCGGDGRQMWLLDVSGITHDV
jgi:hypothetical protein